MWGGTLECERFKERPLTGKRKQKGQRPSEGEN